MLSHSLSLGFLLAIIMHDDANCGDDGNEIRLSLFGNATDQCPSEEESSSDDTLLVTHSLVNNCNLFLHWVILEKCWVSKVFLCFKAKSICNSAWYIL